MTSWYTAHNERSEFHQAAQTWWQELVAGTEPVGIPWQVFDGFIRQTSNTSIMAAPWTPAGAAGEIRRWLGNGHIVTIAPGPRYLEILEQILVATGATRRLVSDATIAALALENGAEVHTNNVRDFQAVPGADVAEPVAVTGAGGTGQGRRQGNRSGGREAWAALPAGMRSL